MVTTCPINVIKELPENFKSCEIKMNAHNIALVEKYIKELIKKKAVCYSQREPGDFVSLLFLVTKWQTGLRFISDLFSSNNFVEKISFKMETLQHILSMIEPQMYQTCNNLQDAFLTVLVLHKQHLYIKFFFKGKILMFLTLSFGYTRSPHLFTKVLCPLVARL